MGEIEFGICDVCGEEHDLQRKYFRYDIKCECHSPQHFEIVRHCNSCVPKEPTETKLTIKTSELIKFKPQEVKEAINYCNNCERDLGFMGSPEYYRQKEIIANFYKKD